jgi:superoxide reductase
MTKVGEIYKCEICGNVVEVLEDGVGTLVCCGEPMKLIEEETDEDEKEE